MKSPSCPRLGFLVLWMLLAGTVLLQGCAAPGRPFTATQPPAAGKGTVYLLRTSALYAVAQPFPVHVDGRDVGSLVNASYLALQMPAGRHLLSVSTGPFGRTSRLEIQVQAGAIAYYQYNFMTGPLANAFFIGSGIEPREPQEALAALRHLKSAAVQDVVDLDLAPLFAGLADVDAIPGLNERGREGYRDWLRRERPRAFVLGSRGAWNSSWGGKPPLGEPADPVERALRKCEQRGAGPCQVYAIDDMVVWKR